MADRPGFGASNAQALGWIMDTLVGMEKLIMALSADEQARKDALVAEIDGVGTKVDALNAALLSKLPALQQQLADAQAALASMTTQDTADRLAKDEALQEVKDTQAALADLHTSLQSGLSDIKGHADTLSAHVTGLMPPPTP